MFTTNLNGKDLSLLSIFPETEVSNRQFSNVDAGHTYYSPMDYYGMADMIKMGYAGRGIRVGIYVTTMQQGDYDKLVGVFGNKIVGYSGTLTDELDTDVHDVETVYILLGMCPDVEIFIVIANTHTDEIPNGGINGLIAANENGCKIVISNSGSGGITDDRKAVPYTDVEDIGYFTPWYEFAKDFVEWDMMLWVSGGNANQQPVHAFALAPFLFQNVFDEDTIDKLKARIRNINVNAVPAQLSVPNSENDIFTSNKDMRENGRPGNVAVYASTLPRGASDNSLAVLGVNNSNFANPDVYATYGPLTYVSGGVATFGATSGAVITASAQAISVVSSIKAPGDSFVEIYNRLEPELLSPGSTSAPETIGKGALDIYDYVQKIKAKSVSAINSDRKLEFTSPSLNHSTNYKFAGHFIVNVDGKQLGYISDIPAIQGDEFIIKYIAEELVDLLKGSGIAVSYNGTAIEFTYDTNKIDLKFNYIYDNHSYWSDKIYPRFDTYEEKYKALATFLFDEKLNGEFGSFSGEIPEPGADIPGFEFESDVYESALARFDDYQDIYNSDYVRDYIINSSLMLKLFNDINPE